MLCGTSGNRKMNLEDAKIAVIAAEYQQMADGLFMRVTTSHITESGSLRFGIVQKVWLT